MGGSDMMRLWVMMFVTTHLLFELPYSRRTLWLGGLARAIFGQWEADRVGAACEPAIGRVFGFPAW